MMFMDRINVRRFDFSLLAVQYGVLEGRQGLGTSMFTQKFTKNRWKSQKLTKKFLQIKFSCIVGSWKGKKRLKMGAKEQKKLKTEPEIFEKFRKRPKLAFLALKRSNVNSFIPGSHEKLINLAQNGTGSL